MSTSFLVAVYFCERLYGGPEEGGWYYDSGELVRICRTFKNEDAAYAYCKRLNERLKRTLNKHRRPLFSVLSSGRYSATVKRNYAEKVFPVSRPHYE